MKKNIKLKVKSNYAKNIKAGYPLIMEDAIVNMKDVHEEGTIIELIDDSHRFLGKGYYGKQNKGRGWVLSQNQDETFDVPFFEKKLKLAIEHRSSLFQDSTTTAFRVFNGEGDGVGGLTIDYYEGYYVISWYSEGVYQFKNEVIQALSNIVNIKGLYEKKRFASQGKYMEDDDFISGEKAPEPLLVKENDMNFAVYLNDGAMVGIFLDQRDVRKTIREIIFKREKCIEYFFLYGSFFSSCSTWWSK